MRRRVTGDFLADDPEYALDPYEELAFMLPTLWAVERLGTVPLRMPCAQHEMQ
jgi:hypothetical protein